MAIIGLAAERPGSPQATFDCGKFTVVRKFLVHTSSKFDGPALVAVAPGIPLLFTPYYFGTDFIPNCRVRSVEPERLAPGSMDWEVTVTYETPDIKGGALGDGGNSGDSGDKGNDGGGTGQETDGQYNNPLLAIPEIETHFETHKIPIYGLRALGVPATFTSGSPDVQAASANWFAVGDPVTLVMGTVTLATTITAIQFTPLPVTITLSAAWPGISGQGVLINNAIKPCMASNGEIFVPPPEMDESHLIMTITRNEDITAPHPALAITYQDVVNSDIFWGALPGQCKCKSITVQRQVKQFPDGSALPYLRVTYIFHFKSSWNIQLLDKGTWYWYQQTNASPVREQKKVTSDGQPVDCLLDGKGGLLPKGASPVFLTISPYGQLPFSALNLPQSFQQVQ